MKAVVIARVVLRCIESFPPKASEETPRGNSRSPEICDGELPNTEAANWAASAIPTEGYSLPGHPFVFTPVAAAFMFAPGDLGACFGLPAVFADDDFGFTRVLVALLGVPADVADARNRCRGSRDRKRQNDRTRGRRQKRLVEY